MVVAVSGLAVVGFLIAHLAGNLLIYAGPMSFNKYAQGLRDLGALLWIMRGGILLAFAAHIFFAIKLKSLNNAARPVNYSVKTNVSSTLASRSMFWTGLTILSFVVFHLAHFTWGKIQPDKYSATWILTDGRTTHDAYKMTVAGFQEIWISALYLIAVTIVFLHLQHAVQSAFQTVGFNHPRYTPIVLKLSAGLSVLLWIGFASIPVCVLEGIVH